ncbi:MAG: GNAT family N-acetyltransferase [Clostridiales bacterium]|nr:GNAT family N-acetyltransferase [Clostridiales bacterium]
MNLSDLLEKALTLPAACAESPFGPESICVRIGQHGRIFASFMPMPGWVSFKCEPNQGMDWRQQYPGTVRRGYHCPPVQQPYNNTITMDGTVPDEVLLQMLYHSYDCALKSLTAARRGELLGVLRPYHEQDEQTVLGWIDSERTYFRWCAGHVGSWPLQPGMLNAAMARNPQGHTFIWQWEGQPAGFLSLFSQKDVENGVRFGFVVLNDALRGAGAGKRMIACAVRYAFDRMKARSLHLSVYSNNPAALHCYEAAGFSPDPTRAARQDQVMGESWEALQMIRR